MQESNKLSASARLARATQTSGLAPILFFAAILFFLARPTFGIYFWLGHEEYYPLVRIKLMTDLWRVYGPFHVPWLPDECFGYGWPFFTFYAPFGYYVGSILHFVFGLNFGDSAKWSFLLSLLSSGVFMWILARQAWGADGDPRKDWAAAGVATLYCLAPYHLADIFVRVSLAESWAFAAVPALFCAVEFAQERPLLGSLAVALATAALMLIHNITALYAALFVGAYFALAPRRPAWFLASSAGAALGLGISAYFWIPAMSMSKLTALNIDGGMVPHPQFLVDHGVHWLQQLDERFGKIGSAPGNAYDDLWIVTGRLVVLAAAMAALAIFRRGLGWGRRYRIFVMLALMLLAMFMASPQMPWDQASRTFRYIQFPWRLTLFSAFFGCAAAAWAAPVVFRWVHPSIFMALAALLYIPPIASTLLVTYDMNVQPIASEADLPAYIDWSQQRMHFAGAVAQEYRPSWVRGEFLQPGYQQANPAPANRMTVLQGALEAFAYDHKGCAYYWSYGSPGEASVKIHVFDFPGWELYIDKKPAPKRLGRADDGLVKLQLPAGNHQIKLVYTLSPIGRKSMRVTMASWAVFALIAAAWAWRALKRPPREKILDVARTDSP